MTQSLFIDGRWTAGSGTRRGDVLNPATGEKIGEVAFAEAADLDAALAAADRAFAPWAATSAYDRAAILKRAAALARDRAEDMAQAMTLEQGKPLAEARMEAGGAGDHIEWYAEEARRTYGRVIPTRQPQVMQSVILEPVGPVAAFSPWNFPIGQIVRKIAGALAAGCTIIAKAPEETPTCVMMRGVQLCRNLLKAPALAALVSDEIAPGPSADDPAVLEHHCRQFAKTVFHPSCTARMGTDAMAVTDPQLRVRGIPRLRIADASVMPALVSGNTNAPSIMIGERCADFILSET